MKDYTLRQLKTYCDGIFKFYGSYECDLCRLNEIGQLCNEHFKCGIKTLPDAYKNNTNKILYVEDGSVDIDELKEILPGDIKVVIYRQGSQKPELVDVYAACNESS